MKKTLTTVVMAVCLCGCTVMPNGARVMMHKAAEVSQQTAAMSPELAELHAAAIVGTAREMAPAMQAASEAVGEPEEGAGAVRATVSVVGGTAGVSAGYAEQIALESKAFKLFDWVEPLLTRLAPPVVVGIWLALKKKRLKQFAMTAIKAGDNIKAAVASGELDTIEKVKAIYEAAQEGIQGAKNTYIDLKAEAKKQANGNT